MWWLLIIPIAYLLYTTAQTPESIMEPSTLDDIDFPTAGEGSEIPLVFGTRDVTGVNVVWYGDFKTIPIKSDGSKK